MPAPDNLQEVGAPMGFGPPKAQDNVRICCFELRQPMPAVSEVIARDLDYVHGDRGRRCGGFKSRRATLLWRCFDGPSRVPRGARDFSGVLAISNAMKSSWGRPCVIAPASPSAAWGRSPTTMWSSSARFATGPSGQRELQRWRRSSASYRQTEPSCRAFDPGVPCCWDMHVTLEAPSRSICRGISISDVRVTRDQRKSIELEGASVKTGSAKIRSPSFLMDMEDELTEPSRRRRLNSPRSALPSLSCHTGFVQTVRRSRRRICAR